MKSVTSAVDKYVEGLRGLAENFGIDIDEIDEAIHAALNRQCGDMCLTRTTLREAIKKTNDPAKRKVFRERAIAWTMEELWGEKIDDIEDLLQDVWIEPLIRYISEKIVEEVEKS